MPEKSLIQDARKFPIGWRIWFWLLIFVNFVVPLFFLQHRAPLLVLLCYMVAGTIMVLLHKRLGWVRLLGIGHVLWIGLLPWLVINYATMQPTGTYGIWLLSVILINAFCLGIDVVDVVRYFFGDKAPLV